MTSVARQPFALLDGSRLQNLTSIKNRQNALSSNSSSKRKASLIEDSDNFENVDPSQFAKRAKGVSSFFPNKEVYKSVILTTKTASNPVVSYTPPVSIASAPVPLLSPRRSILNPKAPSRFGAIAKASPLGPTGRSPARSKRSGLLTSRRRPGPYTRIDPPRLASTPATPFSLDAALKGTIPSYAARLGRASASSGLSAGKPRPAAANDLATSDWMSDDWSFDIHEDTPEQDMTNLLQHSTCVLDISSDEETESKRRREKDEGRDKENVPPADDISQMSRFRSAAPVFEDDSALLVEQKLEAREALREMDIQSYFPPGCDESSIFIVPGDEDAETVVDESEMHTLEEEHAAKDYVFAPSVAAEAIPLPLETQGELSDEILVGEILMDVPSVDELMRHSDTNMGAKAAVLQPVEGTLVSESFELWESGSANDENEAPLAC